MASKLSCASLSPAAAEVLPIPMQQVEAEIFSEEEVLLCDICQNYISENDAVKGLCETCTEHVDDGIKHYTEDFALASVHGKDAVRLFVLRQRADNCRDVIADAAGSYDGDLEVHEASLQENFLNKLAAECLARLPASFAPWWRDTWTHEKWCQVYDERKAAGWPLASADVPIVQRLAATAVAQQNKVHEMKKACEEKMYALKTQHHRERFEAWEEGATRGVQDTEAAMKHKLKELEDKHAEVLANIERARKEDMEAVEARHQRELEEAWEAGAMQGVQDTEDVMKDKLEELEAEHKKQMAAVTEASAEASNAVGEAAEKMRHDARRRGYADGYAFADQKWTPVYKAVCEDLEAVRKEGENHQAGYIRLIGERDEAVLQVVDLRQELDASAEAKEKLEAQAEALRAELDREVTAATRVFNAMESDLEGMRAENKALKAAAAANYQAGYSAAEEKFRAEFQELRKCRADATDIFQAMRSDLERLSAENKALQQQIVEDKQMVQRHLKEVAQAHAAATAWEKEEFERMRKDVRAHEARVGWHADMAKRDMEEKVAEIKGLEAQVADHSRWRDEANHAASMAELEAKKLRVKLAEADWDKEQLLKAVEALRQVVGPTQKLMASNPELFGGEARGTSSPMPPPIIRLPHVKEEDTERVEKFLKGLVRPFFRDNAVVDKPSPLPGIVEAQEGLCEVWTVAEAEAVPQPAVEAKAVPQPVVKPKPNYNHPNWPSPITKRFAKHLAKHSGRPGQDPKTIKTHQDALEFIAKRANVSVETLLKWTINHYQSFSEPWTLVKGGSQHFHMGTAPATWWC